MSEKPPAAAPAFVCLTAGGARSARAAAAEIGGEVHGRAGRVDADAVDAAFDDAIAHIETLFAAGRAIVGVCAAGVLIRAIAPHLASKASDPPVLALAEDGSSVVPLLGGHRGANDLARRIADALGGHAAITTAGDLAFGAALDSPPAGWRLADGDPGAAAAAALAGAPLELDPAAQSLFPKADAQPLAAAPSTGPLSPAQARVGSERLTYAPRRIALGVGCERGADPSELAALAIGVLDEAGAPPAAVAAIGTLDLKADEAAVLALAERFDAPIRLFEAAELEALAPRLANPSETVFREVGCHGVAEAAALALADGGPLIVEKTKSARATAALALAPEASVGPLAGRGLGRLSVVGLGPGRADWRIPAASRAVAEADEVVGYTLYLELLGPLARGKARRDFPLGAETERCRYALERAGEGRRVALVCSGDSGVYAMGALVMELLDRDDALSDAARRTPVEMIPGVSALQAASAKAGALLGHDFCAISLSDLLTPWAAIEARVRAAAAGDFVVAFYNPVSKRRRTQLHAAKAILLEARPADSPVVLGVDLGRPAERLTHTTLGALDPEEVDMLTTVLVGSSASRAVPNRGAYTPRGYEAKR